MIEVLMTPTSELSDNIVYDDMEQEELKVKQAKEGTTPSPVNDF